MGHGARPDHRFGAHRTASRPDRREQRNRARLRGPPGCRRRAASRPDHGDRPRPEPRLCPRIRGRPHRRVSAGHGGAAPRRRQPPPARGAEHPRGDHRRPGVSRRRPHGARLLPGRQPRLPPAAGRGVTRPPVLRTPSRSLPQHRRLRTASADRRSAPRDRDARERRPRRPAPERHVGRPVPPRRDRGPGSPAADRARALLRRQRVLGAAASERLRHPAVPRRRDPRHRRLAGELRAPAPATAPPPRSAHLPR